MERWSSGPEVRVKLATSQMYFLFLISSSSNKQFHTSKSLLYPWQDLACILFVSFLWRCIVCLLKGHVRHCWRFWRWEKISFSNYQLPGKSACISSVPFAISHFTGLWASTCQTIALQLHFHKKNFRPITSSVIHLWVSPHTYPMFI